MLAVQRYCTVIGGVRSGSNTSWVNNLFQKEAGSIKIYLLLVITLKHKT